LTTPEPRRNPHGPQKLADWGGTETESLLARREVFNELSSLPKFAHNDDSVGLRRFPKNPAFELAAARLSLLSLRFDDAARHTGNVLARAPLDDEALYDAGVAQPAWGREATAARLLSKLSVASRFAAAGRPVRDRTRRKGDAHGIGRLAGSRSFHLSEMPRLVMRKNRRLHRHQRTPRAHEVQKRFIQLRRPSRILRPPLHLPHAGSFGV
jgi:hypothetical protein